MYNVEDLQKYDYFKGADINFVLDSLTGVISRQYILDFARTLVSNKTPFTMCIMDLDNFKYVNDSYGHSAGDECLKTLGENLIKYVGNDGLVGRFGGDEFIIIYLKSVDYDVIHDFLANMYTQEGAVRKFIYVSNVRIFLTATVGCASYPVNAETYDDLFMKMDKALYRGKSKGRNCYIIYVHEKHKDIVINERGTNSLLSKLEDVKRILDTSSKEMAIKQTVNYLFKVLHTANVFFINNKNVVISAKSNDEYYFGNNAHFIIEKMVGDRDVFSSSNPKDIKDKYPNTTEYLDNNRVHAFVIAKVGNNFLALYENSVTRMWQDYDLVLIFYAADYLNRKLNN